MNKKRQKHRTGTPGISVMRYGFHASASARRFETMRTTSNEYKSQAARDAQARDYGDESYWQYLDQSAQEKYEYFMRHDDPVTAESMLTRSLSESLMGNEGD